MSMRYVTSVERIGIEKGRLLGLEKGLEQGLEQGLEETIAYFRQKLSR